MKNGWGKLIEESGGCGYSIFGNEGILYMKEIMVIFLVFFGLMPWGCLICATSSNSIFVTQNVMHCVTN
jgi:hypothetical protein